MKRRSSINIDSLSRWVVDKLNALGNVALKTLVTSLEELLLVVIDTANDVDRLLGSVGLCQSQQLYVRKGFILPTPSSIGTEKKSEPVAFAIASPPSTPGR